MAYNEDVPRIEAQCSSCGAIYDLKYSIVCTACGHTGVKYARLVNFGEEYIARAHANIHATAMERFAEVQSRKDYPGKLCSPYALTEGEQKDITELEKLYSLEDTR